MGYSQYWRRQLNVPIPDEAWEGLVSDVQKLTATVPELLLMGLPGADGKATPGGTFTMDEILFHPGVIRGESLRLSKNPVPGVHDSPGEVFGCCKTHGGKYDMLVTACLLAALSRAPGAWIVSSDGEVYSWETGFRHAVLTLDRDMPLRDVEGMQDTDSGGWWGEKDEETPLERLERELNWRGPFHEEKKALEGTLPDAVLSGSKTTPRI